MIRFFLLLIGFGFSIIGFMYIILYLNYLTIGYSFIDYLLFISRRIECYFSIIGIILITISIFKRRQNDLYL